MNLKTRIEQLEENCRAHCVEVMEQIQRAAFRTMGDDDLMVRKRMPTNALRRINVVHPGASR